MKRLSLLFCCFTLTLGAGAQPGLSMAELVAIVKAPYTALDTAAAKINTGYLIDQAVDLVGVPIYNGQELCDSNYVEVSSFCELFRTLGYAAVNDRADVYDADSLYNSLTSSTTIKLCSAIFGYNYILENALTDELIEYDSNNNMFHDHFVGNVWQNPYGTDYVFMFTAGKHVVYDTSVTFDLSSLSDFGNCDIVDVKIDYGDGLYMPLNNATTHQVSYSTAGLKELRLKVTLSNNTVLESHTSVYVRDIIPRNIRSDDFPPDSTFTVSYGSISASCYIKYADTLGHRAVKPLIYVEGFDPPLMSELAHIESIGGICPALQNIRNDTYTYPDGDYYFGESRDRDIVLDKYDLFYVNWNDPEADIKDNAVLLKEIIRKVNQRKPSDGSGDRTIIVAHSMGGLIARCALCQMEAGHEPHQVGWYVSQDVPHLGAVVPIGMQYTIRDLYHCFAFLGLCPTIRSVANKIMAVLDCTAARQMMYNYLADDGGFFPNYSFDNSVHQNWLQYINGLGFPQGDPGHPIENLSIVSGNRLENSELSKSLFTFGLAVAQLETVITPLPIRSLTVSANIDRDRQTNTTVSETTIVYTHRTRIFTPLVITLMAKSHNSPGSIQHYDCVPGSYLYTGIEPGLWHTNPFLYINTADQLVFIPTASSFAVDNYNADFYSDPFSYSTPFHAFCFEKDPRSHAQDLHYYLDWITEQHNLEMNRSFVLSGDEMSIINKPDGIVSEEWQSLNNSVASINSLGEVSVAGPGIVTVSYSASKEWRFPGSNRYQKRSYSKRHTLLAGFPNMTLTYTHNSGNQYTVSAECASQDTVLRAKLDELAAAGEIKYIWGYKGTGNSYTWTDTTSTRSFVCTALSGEKTRVCLKLSNTYNGVERTSSINIIEIDRSSANPFFFEPIKIQVSEDEELYQYNLLFNTTVSSNRYLAVWKNENHSPTPPAPTSILINDTESLPLVATYQTTIAGDPQTVYCFDIQSSQELQDAIDSMFVLAPPFNQAPVGCFIPIKIRGRDLVLQTIILQVYKQGAPSIGY